MSAVQRLGHVAIRVSDMDRAVGFYTALGMRLVWELPAGTAAALRKARPGIPWAGLPFP